LNVKDSQRNQKESPNEGGITSKVGKWQMAKKRAVQLVAGESKPENYIKRGTKGKKSLPAPKLAGLVLK